MRNYSVMYYDPGSSNPVGMGDGLWNLTLNMSRTATSSAEEEYYYYDYNESISNIPLGELIPVAIVYGLTLILGVIGNALVIFSICRYRRMQTVTNIFLTSLASADLLLVLLCVPIKFAKWFTFTWEFGEVLCRLVHYMQNVSVICSILTLTGMSMERYYAIIHPMKAMWLCTVQRAKRVIIVIWIISFISGIPIIFGQVHKEVGLRHKAYWCVKEWPSHIYSQIYEVGMLLLIFIFPLIIISFAYISLCIELWVMTSRRAAMCASRNVTSNDYETELRLVDNNHREKKTHPGQLRVQRRNPQAEDNRTSKQEIHRFVQDMAGRKQVIKMLVIVIVLFAVCWGPVLIDNVLKAFEVVDRYNYGAVKHLRQVFALLSYANSCVNPIVYAFMSRNFRESFRNAIYSCLPGGRGLRHHHLNHTQSHGVSFQTRNSSIVFSRGPAPNSQNAVLKSSPTEWNRYKLIPGGCGNDSSSEAML